MKKFHKFCKHCFYLNFCALLAFFWEDVQPILKNLRGIFEPFFELVIKKNPLNPMIFFVHNVAINLSFQTVSWYQRLILIWVMNKNAKGVQPTKNSPTYIHTYISIRTQIKKYSFLIIFKIIFYTCSKPTIYFFNFCILYIYELNIG